MKRSLIHLGLGAIIIALLWCVYNQHQQLATLRAQQARLVDRLSPSQDAGPASEAPAASSAPTAVSPELLRLRSEATRLSAQRRELTAATTENERLKSAVASRAAAGSMSGPGAIEMSKAQFVGYKTPEDAVQSTLWSMRQQDITNYLQGFSPEMAADLYKQYLSKSNSAEFFEIPGLKDGVRIVDRIQKPDGSVVLSIQNDPDKDPEKTHFYMVNGQWHIGKFSE